MKSVEGKKSFDVVYMTPRDSIDAEDTIERVVESTVSDLSASLLFLVAALLLPLLDKAATLAAAPAEEERRLESFFLGRPLGRSRRRRGFWRQCWCRWPRYSF